MKQNIEPILLQLHSLLLQISDAEYRANSHLLNHSSVGAHTRHIIELFQCLLTGYDTGIVNYDSRKRDQQIESERLLAAALLTSIIEAMDKPNRSLALVVLFAAQEDEELIIDTNFYREALYNLEHAIHHMALIRVALNEVSAVEIDENFGVAVSTIQYRKACAQ